jgi:hypothetical protein
MKQGAHPMRAHLENDAAVVFALDSELRISYCNAAWDRFALENGGREVVREKQIGRSIWDVIPGPLRRLYEDGYMRTLATGEPWRHEYECSSGGTYRALHMSVYLETETGGLLVVNSVAVEHPHYPGIDIGPAERVRYHDEDGAVVMCCVCRKTRRGADAAEWDWVPAFVESPPARITHGLCRPCLTVTYPDALSL